MYKVIDQYQMNYKRKKSKQRELITFLSGILELENKEQIGIGSFAQVYKVLDKRDSTFKALRQISKKEQDIEDIEKEKQINQKLKTLNHNNILKVFQVFEDPQQIYYLTEYCQGGSLWEALNYVKGKKFTEQQSTLIVLQIAKALAVLHDIGIAHRDLKPENILLVSQFSHEKIPDIKLADFGLSTNKMLMETIAGTKEYIAPEQVKKQKYTKAVDIWALGIIYDQLIHGVPYFTGEKHEQVFEMIVKKEYRVRNDKLKMQTKSLLMKMLKRYPHQRPKISDVIEKLNQILQTFEASDRKKALTPKVEKSLEKIIEPKSVETYDLKNSIDEEQRKAKADLHCNLHEQEIKLYRRGRKEVTCIKCLETNPNIITVEEYLEQLKVLNQEKKDKIVQELRLPTVNLYDFSGLVKNQKLSREFFNRREEMSKAFVRLKNRYSMLNYASGALEKKEQFDKCRQELTASCEQYHKTIDTCGDILLSTVELKIHKYLDNLFKDLL